MDQDITAPEVPTGTQASAPPKTDELPAETLAEFDEVAPVADDAAQTTSEPDKGTVAAVASAEAAPATADASAAAPAPQKKTGEAAPETPAEPAAASPAVAHEFKGEDKFSLDDKTELSRDQVRFLLNAYNAGNTRDRSASDTYRDVFQMDAETAKKEWGPVIAFLRQNAEAGGQAPTILQNVLDSIAAGGESAERYFGDAISKFQAHLSANPQVQPAKVDDKTAKRVDQLEAQIRGQAVREAEEYVARERTVLEQQYPVLKDPQIWQMFAGTAMVTATANPKYTLTQAAKDQKRALDMWQDAFDRQNAAETAAQPAAETKVPALVHSNGASPGGTRAPAGGNEELSFGSLDEATEEYLRTHPQPID